MSGWIHVFWAPEGIFFFNWMKYSIFSTLPFAFPALWPPGHRGTQAVVMCTGSGMRELRNALQHKLVNLLNTLRDFGGFLRSIFFFHCSSTSGSSAHVLQTTVMLQCSKAGHRKEGNKEKNQEFLFLVKPESVRRAWSPKDTSQSVFSDWPTEDGMGETHPALHGEFPKEN